MKPGSKVTAEELQQQLDRDPAYLKMTQEKDRTFASIEADLALEESDLVRELREAGVSAASAWGLVNTKSPYPKALPVLIKHLNRPYSNRTKEGIIRALAVPEARVVWPTLVQMYLSTSEDRSPEIKDALAVAIAGSISSDRIDELMTLVQNRSHGKSRVLLLGPLRRSRSQKVRAVLAKLREDPDLHAEFVAHRSDS